MQECLAKRDGKEANFISKLIFLSKRLLCIIFDLLLFSNVIFTYVYPPAYNALTVTNTTDTTQAVETLHIIEVVWKWWPLILIFGLIAAGFVASQKKEPDEYYF